MSEHPIQGMMGTTMQKIREMVDVNTIIGEPILTADGTTIIPVSKVSFGFASGGSDIPAKVQKDIFGGASGAGVSIQPLAFLVVKESEVKLLQMDGSTSTGDKAITMLPEVLEKIGELFSKKKDDNKTEE